MKTIHSIYLAVMLTAFTGCATSVPGILREQALYRAGTNGLYFVDRYIAPEVPFPWNGVVGGATALAAGLLGVWNLNQEKRLRSHSKLNGTLPKS